jgi:tight adherence protein B
MTSDGLFGWCALLLFSASAGLGWAASHTSPTVAERSSEHIARLEHELRYQGATLTGAAVARAQAGLGLALLAASPYCPGLAVPIALAAVGCGPAFVLRRLRQRRTARIESQLDGFLLALAHSLRATPALGDGLRCSADIVAPPLADELQVLLREHELGTPLDRALENMAARIQSPIVSAALSALRIARGAGGDFVHTLERSAATLREMARLEGVVRAKTAEGRAQTVAVSILPPPTLYVIDRMSPAVLEPLWTTDAGHVLLAIAFVIWVVAILAARRIAQVDI